MRTMYFAIVYIVSRKIYHWADEIREEEKILFNQPEQPELKNQTIYDSVVSFFLNYYDHLSYITWPSFLYEMMFCIYIPINCKLINKLI